MQPTVKFKRLTMSAVVPTYQTAGASGMDLYADSDFWVPSAENNVFGVCAPVSTGIAIELPLGFEGQIRPRSGLSASKSITVLNTPGSIDADYRGELKVLLVNHGRYDYNGHKGDRIAQLVIAPVSRANIKVVETLSTTDRGSGGFGSTGK